MQVELYPNVAYFTLAKEMPSAKIGTMVTIIYADGRECLFISETSEDGRCAIGNGIQLDIGLAKRYPEWFKAVTHEEHSKICKENTIKWAMDKGKTKEQAEKIYEMM